ncbi:MAG: NERD domain-containing protein [Candidatus Desulfofervidaceae bacterium]|nr:NERD domain-containing protein [Candidatus Desulfofervidaceae bacterium]
MALQAGQAGKSVRKMEKERFKKRLYTKIAILIFLWFLIGLFFWQFPRVVTKIVASSWSESNKVVIPKTVGFSSFQAFGFSGLVVLLLGARMLAGNIFRKTEKKATLLKKRQYQAARGAAAEESIGEILKQLPDDFVLLHDVPSPYGNIDHIVASKNHGIFLLETKSHYGKITTNGKDLLRDGQKFEKDFISQILKNTFWLRDEIKKKLGISVFINPILVFTSAFVAVKAPISGVTAVNKKYLINAITKEKSKIDGEVIKYLLTLGSN